MNVQIKKQFVFPVLVAMMLVGCSKDSLVTEAPPAPIAFNVVAGTQTKATPVEQGDLSSDLQIKAFKSDNSAVYFNDTFLKRTPGGWGPTAGQYSYYWPSNNLYFLAFYPSDLATYFGNNDVREGESAEYETEFWAVAPKKRANQQKDFLVGKTGEIVSGTATVSLHLFHVLSQIEVQARCLNPNLKVVVKGIKLVNIWQQGRLKAPLGGYSEDNFTSSRDQIWVNVNGNGRTTYYAGCETGTGTVELVGATSAAAQSIMMTEGSFMLLPQSNDLWNGSNTSNVTGSYIAVLCQIWQKNSSTGTNYPTLIYPSSSDKYGWAAVGIGPNWQPGVKYTYTLEFFKNGGGAGNIPPDQTNPNTDTDSPQEVEEGTGGTSVAGGALSFTVTSTPMGTPSGTTVEPTEQP